MQESFWTGGIRAHSKEIETRFDARLATLRSELESTETNEQRDQTSQLIESTKNARQIEVKNCNNKLF